MNEQKCTSCDLPIEGQFVRAIGGCYHMSCFKCHDCQTVVASRFFPMAVDGKQVPLCEKDYFGRHDLLCAKCGAALRGSYITALDKKYHLEHFTCSKCDVVFGAEETYFEHEGEVFCHFHYSSQFASQCGGCGLSILKQFVEVKGEHAVDQWHPECYMIYKSWSIRMQPSDGKLLKSAANDEELKIKEKVMEEKVNRIWTVLSAFEESAAACISDMLLHVSNQAFVDAVSEAGNFIIHVDVLFAGIDALEDEFRKYNDATGLSYNKEPKMLAKKIVNFFSLLSHTQESGSRQFGTVTQELLSLVTSLAQFLKVLIRIALAGALRLENVYKSTMSIGNFLNKLIEVGEQEQENENAKFDSKFKLSDMNVKSDLCMVCHESVEEACVSFGVQRWHKKCLQCSVCRKDLADNLPQAFYDAIDGKAYCIQHQTPGARSGFENVSQLQEFTFLLRVALKRLYSLLKIKDDSAMSSSQIHLIKESPVTSEMDLVPVNDEEPQEQQQSQEDVTAPQVSNRRVSFAAPSVSQPIQTQRLENVETELKKPQMDAVYESLHNLIEDTSTFGVKNLSTSMPESHSVGLVGRAQQESSNRFSVKPQIVDTKPQNRQSNAVLPQSPLLAGRTTYLSELSALETFIVRHLAVLKMQPFVKESYSVGGLVDLLREKKASFWTKILEALNPSKKPVKAKDGGNFGIALDVVVEKHGVETKLGTGTSRCTIPVFVDNAINALKGMDLQVEGIFRKNGNIKALSALQDTLDQNPQHDLSKENPIQVGALLKKYLRELPEPLLTYKLYKLFIMSQKLSNQEQKKKMLHYVVCLLPKPNRDLFEVLLVFLRDVSRFTENKMDLNNLATVFTPNILYAKATKQTGTAVQNGLREKEESIFAIETIKSLLHYQDTLWQVPQDILEALQNNNELLTDDQITSKEVIKKYENMKKSQVSSNQASISKGLSPQEAGEQVIVDGEERNTKPKSGGQ